jgi:signal transduction histidine kinase
LEDHFIGDIAAVQRIAAVPSILDIVCRVTGMGFAAVARVTEDRWIACQVLDNIHFGLPPGGELKVETTLCHEVRQQHEVIVFDHADEDARFRDHHTPRIYGLQSYISVPIILPDGRFFGTLCAIDPSPHKVDTPEIIGSCKLFAELIAYHLDADEKLRATRADLDAVRAANEHTQLDLAQALANSELREQFIAVLGHDLRNPIAGFEGGRRMLVKAHGDDPKSERILRLMGESVTRMSGLINNVMDFARGRLGGGIGLSRTSDQRVEPTLAQVIDEMRAGHPERMIETRFELTGTIDVDHERLAQLLSNLLGNAITHGATDQPIVVEAKTAGGEFILSVANGGDAIPPAVKERLFQPFHRGDGRSSMQGLGLGLYIASQIAQAHGGTLDVASDDTETRFTFRMTL